ncbi:PREDICTED: uncharacterized protein LOC108578274, partial [Habropoda laboriosa]|uniref:uncharacterized protein LOC108578274 n=1 Tax=Habropoda laboriosa TaxID=597456 RepID=UPI00083DC245
MSSIRLRSGSVSSAGVGALPAALPLADTEFSSDSEFCDAEGLAPPSRKKKKGRPTTTGDFVKKKETQHGAMLASRAEAEARLLRDILDPGVPAPVRKKASLDELQAVATSMTEAPLADIGQQTLEAAETVYKVAARSGHLQGQLAKALKDSADVLVCASLEVIQRVGNTHLEDDNRALTAEVVALRAEVEELKSAALLRKVEGTSALLESTAERLRHSPLREVVSPPRAMQSPERPREATPRARTSPQLVGERPNREPPDMWVVAMSNIKDMVRNEVAALRAELRTALSSRLGVHETPPSGTNNGQEGQTIPAPSSSKRRRRRGGKKNRKKKANIAGDNAPQPAATATPPTRIQPSRAAKTRAAAVGYTDPVQGQQGVDKGGQAETWARIVGRREQNAARRAATTAAPPTRPRSRGRKAGTQPPSPANQRLARLRRAPRTAAVTITLPPGGKKSLTEVVSKAEDNLILADLRIEDVRHRRARTGGLLLEISGPEREAKAQTLANKLTKILGEDAKAVHPNLRTETRVHGRGNAATPEKVAAGVAAAGGCAV